MLYEMLTGQPPYTGESIPQLCAALLHDDPIPLRQHRAEIPEGLEQAVLRCLMKDRNHRFPTVFELGRALLPYALPDSRIHVERAERVLGVKDATMSGLAPFTERVSNPMLSTPAVTAPRQPMAVTPQPAVDIMDPTINSWGHTGTVQTPRRRGALIAIGVVAALLAGAAGIWAAGRGDERASALKPSASAATSGAEPAKAEIRPTEAPAVLPDPSTPAAAVASAAIAETPPAPAAPAAPAKLKASLAAPPPKPPAVKKPEPKKPESGITDFGGRR
jgi:serine/threonine-protein kinase